MTLTDKAKFMVEASMVLLSITYTNLRRVRNEMEDCAPAEYAALERLGRLVNELDDGVSEVLQSIRVRKREAKDERGGGS